MKVFEEIAARSTRKFPSIGKQLPIKYNFVKLKPKSHKDVTFPQISLREISDVH